MTFLSDLFARLHTGPCTHRLPLTDTRAVAGQSARGNDRGTQHTHLVLMMGSTDIGLHCMS